MEILNGMSIYFVFKRHRFYPPHLMILRALLEVTSKHRTKSCPVTIKVLFLCCSTASQMRDTVICPEKEFYCQDSIWQTHILKVIILYAQSSQKTCMEKENRILEETVLGGE